MPKDLSTSIAESKKKIKGDQEPQNQQHNVKKEALGPNTRRK